LIGDGPALRKRLARRCPVASDIRLGLGAGPDSTLADEANAQS
jgi:hypothetical protein